VAQTCRKVAEKEKLIRKVALKTEQSICEVFSMWSAPRRLLCNGEVNTFTAIEGLCFLRGPCRVVILKAVGATVAVARYSPNSNDVSREAGESSLLRFVTRERLLEALQRNSHY
jgi:hypothetical protein